MLSSPVVVSLVKIHFVSNPLRNRFELELLFVYRFIYDGLLFFDICAENHKLFHEHTLKKIFLWVSLYLKWTTILMFDQMNSSDFMIIFLKDKFSYSYSILLFKVYYYFLMFDQISIDRLKTSCSMLVPQYMVDYYF